MVSDESDECDDCDACKGFQTRLLTCGVLELETMGRIQIACSEVVVAVIYSLHPPSSLIYIYIYIYIHTTAITTATTTSAHVICIRQSWVPSAKRAPREPLRGHPVRENHAMPKRGWIQHPPAEPLWGHPVRENPKHACLGTPNHAFLGTPKHACLGAPKQACLGFPKQAGAEPADKKQRAKQIACAGGDVELPSRPAWELPSRLAWELPSTLAWEPPSRPA